MPRTRSAERTQFLHDIMICAIEGGVGYWSYADKIVRNADDDLWYSEYTLYCWEGSTDPKTYDKIPDECGMSTKDVPVPACKGHRVTPDVVAHGLTVICDTKGRPDISLHIDYRKNIREASIENEGGDIDAGLADEIIQAGVFERCIYG